MKNKIIHRNIARIKAVSTSHGVGEKQILITGKECLSNLTQAAYGCLEKNEVVELHIHSTMEEFYFLLSGTIVFQLDGVELNCNSGDFIMVPANCAHKMKALTDTKFIYWGISC